ncbi:MAG: effector binding domain-containing protein [Candidatus Limiplasma sp.]|nr:effector binding domain-containing protein [Candidatus Limiplasma sp.]
MRNETISQLTRRLELSPRTLRYYEQIGLIQSIRGSEYAYRMYDEANIARIRQIMLLRRLRIPIKQIAMLLENGEAQEAIAVFQEHERGVSREIGSLETLRTVLRALIRRLEQASPVKLGEQLACDEEIVSLIRDLPEEPNKLKEVRAMKELSQEEKPAKLKDVRIVYLPPATVAASHFVGDEPESVAGERILHFIQETDILTRKPDVRLYGFNHPNPVDESNFHGYEFWLTIPQEMELPPPLEKKRFAGGLYAAHMIPFGDFHEWEWLNEWVESNGEYEYRGGGSGENMFDALEEHLNAYTHLKDGDMNPMGLQLDLLIPVKKKRE